MGSQKVRHDWATNTLQKKGCRKWTFSRRNLFTWNRKWKRITNLSISLEEPLDPSDCKMCTRECTHWARPSLGLLWPTNHSLSSIQPRGAPDLCPVLCIASHWPRSLQGQRVKPMQGPCCPPDPRIPCTNGLNPIPGPVRGLYGLVLWKFLGHRVVELGLRPQVSVCILWAPLIVLWNRW